MKELFTSPGFWFCSIFWFILLMMFTPKFEEWSWKQGIFAIDW